MKKTILFCLVTILLCTWATHAQVAETPCGYVPDEAYLTQWQDEHSIPYKRLEFLKQFSLQEIQQIQTLEYKDGVFEVQSHKMSKNERGLDRNPPVVKRIIPIVAHIVRRSNGTGGLSTTDLNSSIARANAFYNFFQFKLTVCEIRYIDSDAIFNNTFSSNSDNNETANASFNVLNVTTRNVARKLNIYFVPNSNTSWAWSPNTNNQKQHILMRNLQARNSTTLSHEIGHWFDLLHTHGSSNSPNELVDGSNCNTAGDFVCDTAADPNLSGQVNSNCAYTGNDVDANGDNFTPDPRNLMSYAPTSCRKRFSWGQIFRMQAALLGMQSDRGYTFLPCLNVTPTVNNFCYYAGGWRTDKHPRMMGDVNGDGRDDIIGFASSRVYVSLGKMDGTFSNPIPTVNNFGYNQGWRTDRHPRLVGDINGDGRADIVGFGHTHVIVALGQSNGTFSNATVTINNFCYYAGGWRVGQHPRTLADVNGDGRMDIVGFGGTHVLVALGQSNGTFSNPFTTVNNYCIGSGGWTPDKHLRFLNDVNGDGRADIVGFGDTHVYVSLGLSNGRFTNPIARLNAFCQSAGAWRVNHHPRLMEDVNGDGRADIVGFANSRVYVALGRSDGGFFNPIATVANYGTSLGWRIDRHPRMLGDVNGDGRADIVGFGNTHILVSLGKTNGRFTDPIAIVQNMCYYSGNWRIDKHPRMLGDVDSDGRLDIIGFGDTHVYVIKEMDLIEPSNFSGPSNPSSSLITTGQNVTTTLDQDFQHQLQQNYPNPFVGQTTIPYQLPKDTKSARLMITNSTGQMVKILELSTDGRESFQFDASSLVSGTYNYTLIVDDKVVQTKQMVVK